jgi:hypothetical protein
MLLAVGLVLTYNLNIKFEFKTYLLMLLFNFGMLICGYLGEINKINKNHALLGGYIFFALLFYTIYANYVKDRKSIQNVVIYLVFLTIWGAYGLVSNSDPKIKNITYNTLDVTAKCIVGIGFWAYLSKIFK